MVQILQSAGESPRAKDFFAIIVGNIGAGIGLKTAK